MARPNSKKESAGSLRAVIVAGERYRHAVAARFGLGTSETLIISILCRAGEPLSPSDIAERLMVRSGTLTAMLDRLERAAMIERRAHPSDRRARLIALTEAGQDVISYSTGGLIASLESAGLNMPWADLTAILTAVATQLDKAADGVEAV